MGGQIIEWYIDYAFTSVEKTKNLMAEIHGLDGASPYLGLCLFPSEYTQYALNEDPCTAMTLRGG